MAFIERDEIGLAPARPNSAVHLDLYAATTHWVGADRVLRTEQDLFRLCRDIQYQDMVVKGYSDVMYNAGANPFRPVPLRLRGLVMRNAANGSTIANNAEPSLLFPFGPNAAWLDSIPNARENLIESAQVFDEEMEREYGRLMTFVDHSIWRPTACSGDWVRSVQAVFDGRPVVEPPPVWYPDPDLADRPIVGYGNLTWDGWHDYGYVRWVQMFLNRTSPSGCPVDGVWGPISHQRLLDFQGYFSSLGWPCRPNGITDLDTWACIHLIATQEGIV